MTYAVTEACIRCKYTDCVAVCPVDCFYEGENMLVIHPDECIDCGVCEPECPAEAIVKDTADGAEKWVELPGKVPCSSCGRPRPRPGFPPGIRKDLHGFVDVDAFHPQKGKLYVQASADSGGDVAAHMWKLKSLEVGKGIPVGVLVSRAIRAGIAVEVHGWGKRGPRGKVKHWTRRRVRFSHVTELDPVRWPPGPETDLEWARGLVAYDVEGEP